MCRGTTYTFWSTISNTSTTTTMLLRFVILGNRHCRAFHDWIYRLHLLPFQSFQWSLNIQCLLCFSVCLFQTPHHHSLVIDLGSNHRLTRFHHFITTLVGLASMFQSFVWSMLRMRNAKCGEMKGLNWNSRAWFDMRNRNVVFCKFNRFWIIKLRLSIERTGLRCIVLNCLLQILIYREIAFLWNL